MVAVTGPGWPLRPGSQVYREVRLAAARDATQRAREYAEAFGGRVTGLVEAADTGLLGAAREGGPASFRAMTRAGGMEEAELPSLTSSRPGQRRPPSATRGSQQPPPSPPTTPAPSP